MRILKYQLRDTREPQTLNIGRNATVSHFSQQNGTPTIWVLGDTPGPETPTPSTDDEVPAPTHDHDTLPGENSRTFQLIPTGAEIPDAAIYIGSYNYDSHVRHLFVVG